MYARLGWALDTGPAVFGSLLRDGRAVLVAVLDRLQARVALNAAAIRTHEQRCRAEHPSFASCCSDSWDVIVLGSGSTGLSKRDTTASREVPARVARLSEDDLGRLERCRFVKVLT